MCSAKLSENVIHPLENPEYNFVNEEQVFENLVFYNFGASTKMRVLIAASGEHGHNVPMLPLVHDLRRADPTVTIFWATDEKEKKVPESCGVEWIPLNYHYDESISYGMSAPARQIHLVNAKYPEFLETVQQLDPHVVIYDYFCVIAAVVGEKLGIPTVCFRSGQPSEKPVSSMPCFEDQNLQQLASDVALEKHQLVIDYRTPYLEYYSKNMNLFQVPISWLGPSVIEMSVPYFTIGPSVVARPLSPSCKDMIDTFQKGNPACKVLISMGTVQGQAAKRPIEDQQAFFTVFVSTARLMPDATFVLSIAGTEDILDMKLLNPPSNCTVSSYVPQLEILKHANVFVSHCGANSLHESLWSGVPIVAIPIFADQPDNANRVVENGWGLQLNWKDLTPEKLSDAIKSVASNPDIRQNIVAAGVLEDEAISGRRQVVEEIFKLAATKMK